jgi:O-antigen ligase
MKKIIKTPFLIFITWLAICGSLGMDIKTNLLEVENQKNIQSYLGEFRVLISIVAILAFSIWNFLLFIKKKSFANIFKFNTTSIFILYFLCQFIGLVQNNIEVLNYNNYYLLFLSLGTLNLFLFITNSGNENYYEKLLYLLLVVMLAHSLSILATRYDLLIVAISQGQSIYNLTHPNEIFMGQTIPRITGLSRSFAILNLFLIVWYFHIRYNFGIIKKTAYILLILSVGLLIWAMNSRGTILCYFFALTIYFLIILKENLAIRVKFLILFALIPIVMFSIFPQINISNFEKEKIYPLNNIRLFNYQSSNYSSGRIELWKYSINNYQKNKIFGYGAQGDRYLLMDKFTHYGSNVSNGFIYALLSGGYVGLVFYCFLFLKSFYNIGLIIINRKELKSNFIIKSSVLFLSFFLLRSIVENSFSLFSLDFLIFALSSVILEKFIKEKKLKIPSFKKII